MTGTLTERLLLLEHANNHAELDDEVEGSGGGGPDNREHEQPHRVEATRRIVVVPEVVCDCECGVKTDVGGSNEQDDNKGEHRHDREQTSVLDDLKREERTPEQCTKERRHETEMDS